MIKIEGLSETTTALNQLGMGEHLWVRGIGDNLIRFIKLSETNYRVSLFSVWREAARFCAKNLLVDARVNQTEVLRLVKKLGARPCKVVNSGVIVEPALGEVSDRELSYQDYVDEVKDKGFIVQVNP
jgi:hypothetical protein